MCTEATYKHFCHMALHCRVEDIVSGLSPTDLTCRTDGGQHYHHTDHTPLAHSQILGGGGAQFNKLFNSPFFSKTKQEIPQVAGNAALKTR